MCHSPIVINLLTFNALLETRYVAAVLYKLRAGAYKRHVHVMNSWKGTW